MIIGPIGALSGYLQASASQTVQLADKALLDVQQRIGTGRRVNSFADNPSSANQALRTVANVAGLKAVKQQIAIARNVITSALEGTDKVSDLLQQMKVEIAKAGSDNLTSNEMVTIQANLIRLRNEVGNAINDASYKGMNLLKPPGRNETIVTPGELKTSTTLTTEIDLDGDGRFDVSSRLESRSSLKPGADGAKGSNLSKLGQSIDIDGNGQPDVSLANTATMEGQRKLDAAHRAAAAGSIDTDNDGRNDVTFGNLHAGEFKLDTVEDAAGSLQTLKAKNTASLTGRFDRRGRDQDSGFSIDQAISDDLSIRSFTDGSVGAVRGSTNATSRVTLTLEDLLHGHGIGDGRRTGRHGGDDNDHDSDLDHDEGHGNDDRFHGGRRGGSATLDFAYSLGLSSFGPNPGRLEASGSQSSSAAVDIDGDGRTDANVRFSVNSRIEHIPGREEIIVIGGGLGSLGAAADDKADAGLKFNNIGLSVKSLGLDRIDVSTRGAAGRAVETINNAIKQTKRVYENVEKSITRLELIDTFVNVRIQKHMEGQGVLVNNYPDRDAKELERALDKDKRIKKGMGNLGRDVNFALDAFASGNPDKLNSYLASRIYSSKSSGGLL